MRVRIWWQARSRNCFATPGIVRRVFRRATADVDLGGVNIAQGDLVVLNLASANRDPEQFPDPDRLDLARPVTGHVALGTGRNSCVGAMLIRVASSLATGALTARFAEARFSSVGEWRIGTGFCFPASVYVTLQALIGNNCNAVFFTFFLTSRNSAHR